MEGHGDTVDERVQGIVDFPALRDAIRAYVMLYDQYESAATSDGIVLLIRAQRAIVDAITEYVRWHA